MGDLKVETDALLRDNNFGPDDFSEAVLKNIGFDDWSVSNESESSLAARRDFRDKTTFTIDPTGSEDLDDALHVKELGGNKVEVGIHVADAAHFIRANSLVDREAKKRGTGVYLMTRAVNMLPPRLASEICSLSPGQARFTISVVFEVDLATGIVDEEKTWIGKGIINSSGKLTYDEVDAVIHGDNNVALQGATVNDIHFLKVRFIAQKTPNVFLIHSSPLLSDSARPGMGRRRNPTRHFDCFISWMMRMYPSNTIFLLLPLLMRLLKSSATRRTHLWHKKS